VRFCKKPISELRTWAKDARSASVHKHEFDSSSKRVRLRVSPAFYIGSPSHRLTATAHHLPYWSHSVTCRLHRWTSFALPLARQASTQFT